MRWVKIIRGMYVAEGKYCIHLAYWDSDYWDYCWEYYKKTPETINALINVADVDYPHFRGAEGLGTLSLQRAKRKIERRLTNEERNWNNQDIATRIKEGMLRTVRIERARQEITYPVSRVIGS